MDQYVLRYSSARQLVTALHKSRYWHHCLYLLLVLLFALRSVNCMDTVHNMFPKANRSHGPVGDITYGFDWVRIS